MKRVFFLFSFIFLFVAPQTLSKNENFCPFTMQHSYGIINNVIDSQHQGSADKYWCLSEPFIDDGQFYQFFLPEQPSYWLFNNLWAGNQVCCGCSFTGTSSCTMIAKVEQNRNHGTAQHSGEFTVELVQKCGENFYFSRLYDRPISPIPTFHISNYSSTGPGGVTTVTLDNWGTVPGPAHYWIRLQNGSEGDDLPLDNLCKPNCNSPCPAPIGGYVVKAITAPCTDGTCGDPTPVPPATGIAFEWNLTVTNGTITPRIPTFPVTIQISNPSTCNATNRYIYMATQLLYGDQKTSYYVSQNSIAMDWCLQNPAEAGKLMQCQKAGDTEIMCTYTNGGDCAIDNTIYYGPLSAIASYGYSNSICPTGINGTVTFDPGSGDWFWVIVSNNGIKEGSYGMDSNSIERPEAIDIGTCDFPQDLTNTCY